MLKVACYQLPLSAFMTMKRFSTHAITWFVLFYAASQVDRVCASVADESGPTSNDRIVTEFVDRYCLDCHNEDDRTGGFSLDVPMQAIPGDDLVVWEKAIRKVHLRQMPPLDATRPSEVEFDEFYRALGSLIAVASGESIGPVNTPALRRLTRTEYQYAIRDLLDLNIDASRLLPEDPVSHGFDNITVTGLSPTHMEQYIAAAEKISRLAVGGALTAPIGETFRVPPDRTQEQHVDGLPLGTRGGTLIAMNFPRDGEYEFSVRLARDRNEEVEGLSRKHFLELLLDSTLIETFEVVPPNRGADHQMVDAHLRIRVDVTAGPHEIGVTFVEDAAPLLETKRQPYDAQFNMHRHPRSSPAIYQVSIVGPFRDDGPGDTPSRRRVLTERPRDEEDVEPCAERILASVLRRAYRRPITPEDLAGPMRFFREGNSANGFEFGIQRALAAILVSPHFLFHIERQPGDVEPGEPFVLDAFALASRLSFFIWSSIPDDELLAVAESGELLDPETMTRQVIRLLNDDKSRALSENFAGQWLHLRNLGQVRPNLRLFPDFDDNLRQAFRTETEFLFESIVRDDLGVLELFESKRVYVNERLAKHYNIPSVYGSRFRILESDHSVDAYHRGGLLRHGSILTVTSYATRTSPVIRGDWILDNLLGSPVPPPPATVPALQENTVASSLPLRERLMQHRLDATCASCHDYLDPVGFSLENFDAVGRWRTSELGRSIDNSGSTPDGQSFDGVAGLESAILARPEIFASAFIEKLMTYGLGRGLTHHDGVAVRSVMHDAQSEDFRFSAIVLAIVANKTFQMRMAE